MIDDESIMTSTDWYEIVDTCTFLDRIPRNQYLFTLPVAFLAIRIWRGQMFYPFTPLHIMTLVGNSSCCELKKTSTISTIMGRWGMEMKDSSIVGIHRSGEENTIMAFTTWKLDDKQPPYSEKRPLLYFFRALLPNIRGNSHGWKAGPNFNGKLSTIEP